MKYKLKKRPPFFSKKSSRRNWRKNPFSWKRNPETSVVCGGTNGSSSALDAFLKTTKGFSSVKDAHAFLEYVVPTLTSKQCSDPVNIKRIEDAKRLIAQTNKRNLNRRYKQCKRKLADQQKPVPTREQFEKDPDRWCPSRRGANLAKYYDISSSRLALHQFEEVLGPEGEVLRVKVNYNKKGNIQSRTPTKEQPQQGNIILDLTTGIKVWVQQKTRRRPLAGGPTSSMRAAYEATDLYKARLKAANAMKRQLIALKKKKKKK